MSEQDAEKESWIRRRAYQLWQEAGESHGRHEDDWNQAGREYDQAMGTPAVAAKTAGDLEQDRIETPPPVGADLGRANSKPVSTTAKPPATEKGVTGKA